MKKIYLVDSENVGDIWVPLLVASQPDEEVIVFYTQKSPHMNYENVRLLKETDKEAKFIKCFEGSNALDFQLVTQLGYLLCENQENSYVIISNDTGFDAAVRYWKQRNMPVQRLSGKELNRRLQQKAKANGEKEIVFEPEKKADGNVAGILADEAETLAAKLNETTKQNETGELDADLELNGFEELTQASKQDETGELDAGFKLKETGELAEVSEPDEIGNRIEVQKLDEAAESDESPEQTETVKRKETAQMEKTAGAEEQSESGEIQMEIPDEIMRPDETVDAEQELPFTDLQREKNEKTQISETQDEVIRSLLTCISKDRLADFHNALVLFFGEEIGKELYQEAKNSSAYAICRVNQTAISEEEKFDVYCQTVFAYSDPKLDCPEDFSSFLYKANAKRKNLNSLRAALQGHYGKDKGMKYYSLFKSHIKIMNRM
ncbi:MAG TPA: hypothetical protein DCS73_12145 [Roseburia sp.]|nr:hypothetical protein [Roseburia sp.]